MLARAAWEGVSEKGPVLEPLDGPGGHQSG